jgi:hypothetical protein
MKRFAIISLFLVLYCSQLVVMASESKRLLLSKKESFIQLTESYIEIESEYENSNGVIDEAYSSGLVSELSLKHRLNDYNFQIGLSFSFLKAGKNKDLFDSSLNLPNTSNDNINTLGNPSLSLVKGFTEISSPAKHFLSLDLKSSL